MNKFFSKIIFSFLLIAHDLIKRLYLEGLLIINSVKYKSTGRKYPKTIAVALNIQVLAPIFSTIKTGKMVWNKPKLGLYRMGMHKGKYPKKN
jgi:hypothetical protein